MKKLFLTSGVILCMACPALATQDISSNGTITVDNESVAAPCTEDVLSDVTQNGSNAFEAKWTPLQYTIAYAKGTAGSRDASYVALGQDDLPTSTAPVTFESTNITLANPTTTNFTATGYHFAGWESPVDLANGNAPTSPATYVLYQGTQASSPNGYYTGGTLASYGYANSAQDRTVTLNAHWVPNEYTVTYHTCASPMAGSSATNSSNTATFDAAYSMPAGATAATTGTNAVATGYVFLGWTESSTPAFTRTNATTGTVTNPWTAPATWTTANDVDVYAVCMAKQYNVSYYSGTHGTASTDPYVATDALTFGETWTPATFAATGITADTGYTFDHWNTVADDTGTTYAAGTQQSAWATDAGLTVYAVYNANTTTITYNCGSNAGQGSTAPQDATATYNSNFAFASNPVSGGCVVPTGYTFNGWRCTVDGESSNLNATALYGNGVTSTTLLTAGGAGATWLYAGATGGTINCVADITANGITLNWYADTVANGGTDPITVQQEAESCTYGGTITIPDQQHQPEKTGYTFSGWHVRD